MKKDTALELRTFANKIAERYSNNARACNHNNETFKVDEVIKT